MCQNTTFFILICHQIVQIFLKIDKPPKYVYNMHIKFGGFFMSKYPKEGRRVKSLPPMSYVSPYIMKTRNTASNFISDTIDIEKAEEYIRKKRKEGLTSFGLLHLFLATYARTVSQRPGINRFIRGQRIYTRDHIEVMMTIKKEMSLESPDTCIKFYMQPDDSPETIYNNFNKLIEENKASSGDGGESDFESTARILTYIPGLILRGAVAILRTMDYFGLLPRFLTHISPFHASLAITSMGSLGIPPIYHHLYDFGNIPVFISYGAKRKAYELNKNGEVELKRYVDIALVTDERICDGYYFASALKMMRSILNDPDQLDTPVEVIKDIR